MTSPGPPVEFLEQHELDPALLAPAALPTPLAIPWSDYWEEDHPRVRLHMLCDLLEMIIRWCTAIALAETRFAHEGQLPEDVQTQIRAHVERPTLGRWMHMLRVLSGRSAAEATLARGIFSISADVDALCPRDGDIHSSVLQLRNHVAHAGGIRNAQAQELQDEHILGLTRLLESVARVTQGSQLVARTEGAALLLMGLEPRPIDEALPGIEPSEGAWLVSGAQSLSLSPILLFGPLCRVNADGKLRQIPGAPAAQLYTRLERDRISYTPIGRDEPDASNLEIEPFRAQFGLNQRKEKATRDTSVHTRFLREAEDLSSGLVGRREEVGHIWSWVTSLRPWKGEERIGWLSAGPGYGKSMLMARIATDWRVMCRNDPRKRGLYLHRFRAGDAGNNRRAFLLGLMGALTAWPGSPEQGKAVDWSRHDNDELSDDIKGLLTQLADRAPTHPGAKKSSVPLFLLMADGLDEVAAQDRGFAALLHEFAGPGVGLLLAGRPEFGLDRSFATERCVALFSDGLGPMSDEDIHSMLLAGLGNARYSLLARDEEDERGVHNVFVDRVVERAKGLPLYVHLLLEDLRAGNLSVHDEERLPDGLNEYYDDLVQRMGLSTVQRDLPLIVAVLAVAEESLDPSALAQLLAAPYLEDEEIYRDRVEAALRVGVGLLRVVPTPEGAPGSALYHQSFREYVAGRQADDDSPAEPGCSALAETVEEARRRLYRAATLWQQLPEGNLRQHLFRWGTEYAVWWQPSGAEAAASRMTDFAYLQDRTGQLTGGEANDLIREYGLVLTSLASAEKRDLFGDWERFIRERAHMLRRGSDAWGFHKILLQLALEHADDSPVTEAARAWWEAEGQPWPTLMPGFRRKSLPRSNLQLVLEGHRGRIDTVLVDGEERLVSSTGEEVRVWDTASGECLLEIPGRSWAMELVAPGRLIVENRQLWDIASCILLGEFNVIGLGETLDRPGYLIAAESNGKLNMISVESGEIVDSYRLGKRPCIGVSMLQPHRALAWGLGAAVWLWDPNDGQIIAEIAGARGGVRCSATLDQERAVVSKGKSLLLLDTRDGTVVARDDDAGAYSRLLSHGDGFIAFDDGEVVAYGAFPLEPRGRYQLGRSVNPVYEGGDSSISIEHQGPSLVLHGRRGLMAIDKGNGEVIVHRRWPGMASYSTLAGTHRMLVRLPDESPPGLRVIELAGDKERFFPEDDYPSKVVLAIQGDQVISRQGGTLHVWNLSEAGDPKVLSGHKRAVSGGSILPGNRFLSYAGEPDLRIWDLDEGRLLGVLQGHQGPVQGVLVLNSGRRALTWGADQAVILWDLETHAMVSRTTGPGCDVSGFHRLDSGQLLSASPSGTLRLWSDDGEPWAVLQGHAEEAGRWLMTGRGQRLVSWCDSWVSEGDSSIRVWSTRRLAERGSDEGNQAHTSSVLGMLKLDGETLLSWAEDQTLRLWSRTEGRPLGLWADHPGNVHRARILPGGLLLTWNHGTPSRLHLWDTARSTRASGEGIQPLATLKGHAGALREVTFLDSGDILTRGPRRFVVWDASSGSELRRFPPVKGKLLDQWGLDDGARVVHYRQNGRNLLAVWEPGQGRLRAKVRLPSAVVAGVTETGEVFLLDRSTGVLTLRDPVRLEEQWSHDTGCRQTELESDDLVLSGLPGGSRITTNHREQIWTLAGERVLDENRWHLAHRLSLKMAGSDIMLMWRGAEEPLIALHFATGEEMGRFHLGEEPRDCLHLRNDILFVRMYQGDVVAWSPHSGRHERLGIDASWDHHTYQRDDGTCITMNEDDELVHWAPLAGGVLETGTPRELLRSAPELVTEYLERTSPKQVCHGWVAVVDGEGIAARGPDGEFMEWHVLGDVTLHGIEPDGRMMVSNGAEVQVLQAPGSRTCP
jgi:WD40 repeat protein